MNDRRAEPRLLCSDLIKVRLEGAHPADVMGNLEDISPSGACVQLEQPVSPGAGIRLTLGRHKFRGRVKYCVYDDIGYYVGVEFEPGKKWSRALYTPKHLLDPRDLLEPGNSKE